jgi:hypothetical protein
MSLRGDVNVALNRLVAEGTIAGFRTNFGSTEPQMGLHVIVTPGSTTDSEDVRRVVTGALEKLVEAPTVTVDRSGATHPA